METQILHLIKEQEELVILFAMEKVTDMLALAILNNFSFLFIVDEI